MTIYDYIFFPSLFILLQFLSAIWIKSQIESLIKHRYDKKLSDYQNEIEIRNRSEIIAQLFAEWTSFPDDFKRLNQLVWEASLWLPDDIVKEIGKRLKNDKNAKQVGFNTYHWWDSLCSSPPYLIRRDNCNLG